MSFTMSLRRGWRMISTPAFRKICFMNNIRCAHVITSTQHIPLPKSCEPNLQIYRLKSKKTRKNKDESDSEDSDDDDDDNTDDLGAEEEHEHLPGAKIVNWNLASTRIDKMLSRCPDRYGRKEIEHAFYDGRILRNGKKLVRKSEEASEGDVVDYVRHPVRDNPALLEIDRIEVLSMSFKPEKVIMKCALSRRLHVKANSGDEG